MKPVILLMSMLLSASALAAPDIDKLPPQAQAKVQRALERSPQADHKYMHATMDGEVLYADEFPYEATIPMGIEGDVDPAVVFKMHSRPGSTNVLYLDFDGMDIQGTTWNRLTCTNCVPKEIKPAKAYDPNNDGEAFAQNELNKIYQIWQRVSDSYSTFDIDVTTEEPLVWNNYTATALFTDPIDKEGDCIYACSAGGVAFVDVFGTDKNLEHSPALVYASWHPESPSWAAVVASHEFGHNLSLRHHGNYRDDGTVNSYYGGHGLGLISWGPTMGSASTRSLNTWSNGEYPNANNSGQDDVAEIGTRLGFIEDEVSSVEAAPLGTGGTIVTRDDTDLYFFDVEANTDLTIRVTPSWITYDPAYYPAPHRRHTRLDVELVLVDPYGIAYPFADPQDTEALIDIPGAYGGRYYLLVNGEGSENYSDYDSVGDYFIAAEFTEPPTPPPPPPPPPPEPERTLTYSLVKVKGSTYTLALQWEGLEGAMVDIHSWSWYNEPTENDGVHSIKVRRKEKGRYFYVCESGSATACTNRINVQF